ATSSSAATLAPISLAERCPRAAERGTAWRRRAALGRLFHVGPRCSSTYCRLYRPSPVSACDLAGGPWSVWSASARLASRPSAVRMASGGEPPVTLPSCDRQLQLW